MALVPKIDPNKIFASNAPSQDKPAAFNNYEKGMDETRKNLGRPTIKQLNCLHQTADQKILWIHQNGGGLPYDPSIEYAENAVTLKDGELQKKQGAGWVIPYLGKSNNLDDVPNKTTARTNLDVYSKIEVDNAISSAIPNDFPNATEIVAGKVKINNTLTSTDADVALTAAQGKVLADRDFGIGQTWQNVKSSRAVDTNYTNATGKAIVVNVSVRGDGVSPTITATVGGVPFVIAGDATAYNIVPVGNVIVPAGATYKISATAAVTTWYELR